MTHRSLPSFVLAATLLLGACVSSPTPKPQPSPSSFAAPDENVMPKTPSTQGASSSRRPGATIKIEGFKYAIKSINVKKGITVTWTNNDATPHTVTGDNGGPKSGPIAPGASYSYTFNTAGTFPYHCDYHPSMQAKITVVP